jgi:membrane protein DedA with SNARE-associated domain
VLAFLNFTHFVSTAGYAAVFVLCVLQSCCIPTSSELTLGFAGALAAQGKLSLAGVIAVGASGEVIGAYLAWAVGRYAGRAAVDRYGRYVLLTHQDLDRAEAWYDRHQRFGVFGSRLLPVIRNFVALPAGIAEVPLVRFGLLTAGGSLVWDGAWAGLGYGVGSHWHSIASGFGDLGYVLAAVALAVVVFAVYHRYRGYKEATSGGHTGRVAPPPPRGPRHPKDAPVAYPADDDGPAGRSPGVDRDDATGSVRWLASSTGRPRGGASPAAGPAGADRWVGGSAGPPRPRTRPSDFPNSPLAAWEAAVARGRSATQAPPRPGRDEQVTDVPDGGVEANGRLTAMLGALLLVLLAVEGVTILRVGPLLMVHVVIGMVLVPVVVLKIGTTTWRFARYYLGSPEYRRKGPPPAVLRLLGPLVVASTVAVVGSGIALLLVPTSLRNELLLIHKVTFFLWFAAMVVHVLGHLLDVAKLAPRDFLRRTRSQVRGAGKRQWAIVGAVCIGVLLAVAIAPKVGPWVTGGSPPHKIVGTHTIVVPSGSQRRP